MGTPGGNWERTELGWQARGLVAFLAKVCFPLNLAYCPYFGSGSLNLMISDVRYHSLPDGVQAGRFGPQRRQRCQQCPPHAG